MGESFHQLVAPTKYNDAANRILSQDTGVSSEEFKSVSKLESNKQSGKLRETDNPASGLRWWQSSYKLQEDVSELAHNRTCLSSGTEDQPGLDEVWPSKSHPQLFAHSQTRDIITQLQGVTPIKLSRRELRHIPTSELSLRRSSLGVGVNSVAADSIEMSGKI